MAENELLHDRQDLSLVHGPRGLVLIDNIGLIGKDREEVNLLMEKICRELCSLGLLTHELCLPSRCCDILGGSTNWMEKGCELAAASGTYEKLRLALQWALGGRRHGSRDPHVAGAAAPPLSVGVSAKVPTGSLQQACILVGQLPV